MKKGLLKRLQALEEARAAREREDVLEKLVAERLAFFDEVDPSADAQERRVHEIQTRNILKLELDRGRDPKELELAPRVREARRKAFQADRDFMNSRRDGR